MNVTCSACSASYDIDEKKVPPTGGFFKCRSCGEPVRLDPPEPEPIALVGSDDIETIDELEPIEDDEEEAAPASVPPPLAAPAPDAIALPGSDEAGSPVVPSAPSAPIDLPTPIAPAPPAAAAAPIPDDLPAAIAPPPPEAPPAAKAAPPRGAMPQFLEDLPAVAPEVQDDEATPAPLDQGLFEDLPAPAAAESLDADLPAPIEGLEEGDLPVAVASEPSTFEAPSLELDDIPAEENPPSLMDELDLDAEAAPSFDLGLESGDAPGPGHGVPEAAAAPSPAPPAPELDSELAGEPARKSRKGLVVALAAVLLVAALGAGAWQLGLLDPLLGQAPEKAPPAPKPAVVATPTPSPTPATPPPAAPAAPTPVAPPPLSRDNVDLQGYAGLSSGTAAWIEEGETEAPPEVLWALYRLADRFGDAAAKASLARLVSKRPADPSLDEMSASAALGSWLLAGKKPAARRLAERLLKAHADDGGHLRYIVARSFNPKRKPELQKARKGLETPAAELVPDSVLLLAELALADKQGEQAAKVLATALEARPNNALRLQAALLLYDAGLYEPLDGLVSQGPLEHLDELAPTQRGSYVALRVRRAIVAGDLEGALGLARERTEVAPQDADAAVELVRLLRWTGGDVDAALAEARKHLDDAQGRAELAFEQVSYDIARNELPLAQQALQEARSQAPGAYPSWLKLAEGRVAEAQGQVPRARVAYNAAAQGRPKLVEGKLAVLLLTVTKPPQLVTKLKALARQSDAALVSYRLGEALVRQGEEAAAAEHFARAAWRDPTVVDPVDLLLAWAQALAAGGEAPVAAARLSALEQHLPKDARIWRVGARLATDRKDYPAAVTAWRHLTQLEPQSVENRIALARALNDAGDFIDAQGELDQLVKENSANATAPVLLELGRAWLKRDEVKARTYYLDANRATPTADGYRLLGELEEGRGKTEEALEAYRHAIELDDALVGLQLRIAQVLAQKGDYEAVAREAQAILKRFARNVPAALLLGDAYRELGKNREAIAAYQNAMKFGGVTADGVMKLARVQLLQQDRLPQAVKSLRQVIKLDPERAEAYYYLGYALKDLGDAAEAKTALQAYVRLAPSGEFAADVRRELEAMETP